MVTINISGKEYELFYNTKAMLAIEKRCGDMSKFAEWLTGNGIKEQTEKIVQVLIDLINGAIYKHNAEIFWGFVHGEQKKFIEPAQESEFYEMILCLADRKQLQSYESAIVTAMNGGTAVILPEGVPEPDPDLLDVESKKKES